MSLQDYFVGNIVVNQVKNECNSGIPWYIHQCQKHVVNNKVVINLNQDGVYKVFMDYRDQAHTLAVLKKPQIWPMEIVAGAGRAEVVISWILQKFTLWK